MQEVKVWPLATESAERNAARTEKAARILTAARRDYREKDNRRDNEEREGP